MLHRRCCWRSTGTVPRRWRAGGFFYLLDFILKCDKMKLKKLGKLDKIYGRFYVEVNTMIRKIISYISVFALLVSLLNLILSLIVYYGLHEFADKFLMIRWPISALIVLVLLLKGKIVINDFRFYHR